MKSIKHQYPNRREFESIGRKIGKDVAKILRQEDKLYNGVWYLWSLGEPQRPLTIEEIREKGLEE